MSTTEKTYPITAEDEAALALVRRGCDELLIESEFAHKLARSRATGTPLRCKLGLDPTAPDIHLGHTVVLNKLRQLQDLGHTVIFLIGDFTSMIGDPSGRNTLRPALSREEIDANAKTYFDQASLVLDRARTEIRYNSEWSEPLGAAGMIRLAARYTLARLLERDDFAKRMRENQPIAMHELLYPLMQGYDSVALNADLELGGTDQASLVLDRARTEIRYNSEWSEPLGAAGMIKLAAKYTLARLLERDDFAKRMRENQPIAMHELLYPLMQGYDSVALIADVELGGTDQKFNLLVGRELQRHYGQEPQCILTMPLLEGLDGVEKMSKSKGNYVGIAEPPFEMFGKVMSISDEQMWRWYDLLSLRANAEIAALRQQAREGRNPRDIKVLLAKEIVERFHSPSAAERAEFEFMSRFRFGAIPEDMPEVRIAAAPGGIGVAAMLKQAQLAPSTSEAVRNVEQGGVRIDGEKVADRALVLRAGTYVVQVGKRRWARVTIA